MSSTELEIKEIAKIAQLSLPRYEIKGVFRLIEDTPAGRKCSYEERVIDEAPLEYLFAGVMLACPKDNRKNGKINLEISVRDGKIRVAPEASSADAAKLKENLDRKGYYFTIFF